MTHALVTELVGIIRRSLRDPGRPLAPALARALDVGGFPGLTPELEEVARRARISLATDEELGLSIGAVLAVSRARAGNQ